MTELQVFRLLVTGSRTWEGIVAEMKLQTVLSGLHGFLANINSRLVVVHGDCPQGADAIARRWCERRGVHQEAYPADWRQYHQAAGPIRNRYMVNLGADMCIGFLRNGSSGTTGCMDLAREKGIPTFVVPWEITETPVVTYP